MPATLRRSPRPEDTPSRSSTTFDVELALRLAAVYLHDGGQWCSELRAYIDRWLDHQLALDERPREG